MATPVTERNRERLVAESRVEQAARERVGSRRGDRFARYRTDHGVWEPHPDHAGAKNFGEVNPSNPTSGV